MSLPTSLPSEVLRFLDWLKKTDGRDKLYRLIAYGSKIPIHALTVSGGSKDTIKRLSSGAKAVGL
jgi:Peroxisomal biogenesis factor 11 (PEX11)